MQKIINKLVVVFFVVSIFGCATVRDVQRGTDIIRTDSELARILKGEQLDPDLSPSTELTQIGDHGKKEGDTLKNKFDKALDAIAYYRIAATAYWKSQNPNTIDNLFAAVNSGIETCIALGDKAPDRDCLYLQLVIPFAGLESATSKKRINDLLDEVNFTDDTATKTEIAAMNKAAVYLRQVKPQVESILSVGMNERMLSHPSMTDYYCRNARAAMRFFDSRTAGYTTKAFQFKNSFPDHDPPLEMPHEGIQHLREFALKLPLLCNP